MPAEPTTELAIRRFDPGDLSAVLELMRRALGWRDDADHEALFRWKHLDNPWGPSPAWLAFDGGRLAALRALMRWEFVVDGRPARAVRAVDTATDPDYQGRGLFTKLTMAAVNELSAEGVDFVFNTPNDQSRPGYVKMGWHVVGRLPVWARPAGVGGLAKLRSARVPAELWSFPSNGGVPAAEALADDGLGELLDGQPHVRGAVTRRSVAFLRWRYGLPELGYRAVTGTRGVRDGVALFRVRRRGSALETAICDVLAPGGNRRTISALARDALHIAEGGHGVGLGPVRPRGFVGLPRSGPILTRRALASDAPVDLGAWVLSLGDVELF
jgi:GNAT superfamily N-acetyltransferase